MDMVVVKKSNDNNNNNKNENEEKNNGYILIKEIQEDNLYLNGSLGFLTVAGVGIKYANPWKDRHNSLSLGAVFPQESEIESLLLKSHPYCKTPGFATYNCLHALKVPDSYRHIILIYSRIIVFL